MVWVIKLGGRVIGHVLRDYAVLEPRIAAFIESCLLAYQVSVILGEEVRTPLVYGFKVVYTGSGSNPGNVADTIAVAVKRCVAHVLHRRVAVVEEKIFALKPRTTKEEVERAGEELFEPG